jgi:hypothetical protein
MAPRFNRASMTIDTAVDGLGIALARAPLAATCCAHFNEEPRLSQTYRIICPQATAKLPEMVTFRESLLAEQQKTARAQEALGSWVAPKELTFPLCFSEFRGQARLRLEQPGALGEQSHAMRMMRASTTR